MIIDRIRGFVRGWPYKQPLKSKTFYTDLNNDKSLKKILSDAPPFLCPNADCPKTPIISGEPLDISKIQTCIYLEDIKSYYCPRCEHTFNYDPNSIGFDDEGIDVSRATDNPVNDEIKSNTIIRSFGDNKGNKVNNSKYEREQKTIKSIQDRELKGNYKEYRTRDGLI